MPLSDGSGSEPLAIEMRGISKRFGNVVANDNVDFAARFDEVHALVGENGAGKSTLMSILAGLYRPDSGTLAIAGQPVEFRTPRDAIDRGIGMVFQHFMLVEPFTVAENVMLGLPGRGAWLETAEVERALTRLGQQYGLQIDPKARVWQLSVGEQQRVEILRLLYRGARILVFDEPTAVLTPQEVTGLIVTLRELAANGYCVVFISHKLDEVLAVADRITVLRRGQVTATVLPNETDRRALARLMVGRELASFVEQLAVDPSSTEAEIATAPQMTPVLQLQRLCVYGDMGVAALSEIDLDVHAGEVLGIAGVAGNGQRELAEAISGLRPVTSGQINVDGRDVTNRSPGTVAGAGVAHIPEDRLATGLIPSLDVAGNAILRQYRRPPLARGPFTIPRAIANFADRLIHDYDVKTAGRREKLRNLSGGNQQKLLLARELVGEPRLIIAVHPTRGVDIGATETIHQLIRKQRQRGAAILLISEDFDELLALADRIAVLFAGRIVGVVDAAKADIEQIGLMMAGIGPNSASARPSIAVTHG